MKAVGTPLRHVFFGLNVREPRDRHVECPGVEVPAAVVVVLRPRREEGPGEGLRRGIIEMEAALKEVQPANAAVVHGDRRHEELAGVARGDGRNVEDFERLQWSRVLLQLKARRWREHHVADPQWRVAIVEETAAENDVAPARRSRHRLDGDADRDLERDFAAKESGGGGCRGAHIYTKCVFTGGVSEQSKRDGTDGGWCGKRGYRWITHKL